MKFLKYYLSIATCTSLVFGSLASWHSVRAQSPQSVTIRFQAKVGKQPFSCDRNYRLGQPATMVTPADYRFYISNVALIDNSGKAVPVSLQQDGKWQYQNVALLDFENKTGGCNNGTSATNDRIIGTVAPGKYRGLQFTLGVSPQLNHADATLAASPLNLTSLWWNWQGGYKFMRVDLVKVNATSVKSWQAKGDRHGGKDPSGFPIHIGSTGCPTIANSASGNCSAPNRAKIVLPNFDPARNTVVADLAALVANTNLNSNQLNTPPGCMSSPTDPDCTGIMAALGLSLNRTPARSQTFLTVD